MNAHQPINPPNTKHIHHVQRRGWISYPVSVEQRLYSALLGPAIFIVAAIILFSALQLFPTGGYSQVSTSTIFAALLATFSRLLIAYVLSLVCAVPLAIVATRSQLAERIFLPLFDVTQSVPVLAFFPVVILVFVRFGYYNAACIFILFLTMMWSLVFNIAGGLKMVPADIFAAAKVFKVTGWRYLWRVLLPAVFPQAITGSLLAWAGGWNVIIVAEVLHTYIPGGNSSQDVFGIGSMLVNAVAGGHNDVFVLAMLVLVAAVAFLNFFVWQKLLRFAEKFRFE